MSDASDVKDVAIGLTGGAVLTAATNAAGMGASEPLIIGGCAGLLLSLTPRSRTSGIALVFASVAGAAVLASRKPSRRQRLLTK